MGVTKPEILLTADPALTLRKAEDDQIDSVLLRAGIPPQGRYLCFALRQWRGFEEKAPLFGAAARYAYKTYGLIPVFTAVEKHLDPAAARLAAQGLDIPHYFLDDAGGAGTIIGALSRMEAVVSMRLHALIFAAGQGIPLAGVVYDPKVSAFLRYTGQDNFTNLEDLTEAALNDCRLDGVAFEGCTLRSTEFSHTPLRGIDLRQSQLGDLRLTVDDLRGAIVAPSQALDLLPLLGVVVRTQTAEETE